MIVVEGPDGAGKTTLIERLSKDLDRRIVHTGGPPKNYTEWIRKIQLVVANRDERVVFDRIPHISEQVYGPIGGRDFMDEPWMILRELKWLRPVIVYCRLASIQQMENAISWGQKAHKPPDHLNQVLANYPCVVGAYDKIMDILEDEEKLTILRYDWTNGSYPALRDQLGELACVD